MKRYLYSSIIVILLLTSIFSCSEFKTIVIENKKPAPLLLPPEIQSMTLMNRSITSEFANFNKDSLQKYFVLQRFLVDKYVLDSLASDTCLQAIGNLLYESGRFDIVIPTERNIYRDSPYSVIEQPLPWNYVDSICQTYNTDALLVMEQFNNHIKSTFNSGINFVTQEGVPAYNYYYASYDAMYHSFFRIYYPAKKEIAKQFFIKDTIFWENAAPRQDSLWAGLPQIKEGLVATGIKLALDVNDQLSPNWEPDSRGIFMINGQDAQEDSLIAQSNWEKLAAYWQPFLKSKNKGLRSKAEFNMALYNELNGELDKALEWAQKSQQSKYRNQTYFYIQKLQQRLAELARIEQELKEIE